MKETVIIAAARGAGLSGTALGICLPLVVIMIFVSVAAHSEAEKEYERKKQAGEPVPSRVGLSWVSLVSVLPENRRRMYFLFVGACFVVVFTTVLIDEIVR